jgi:hypothetical protein
LQPFSNDWNNERFQASIDSESDCLFFHLKACLFIHKRFFIVAGELSTGDGCRLSLHILSPSVSTSMRSMACGIIWLYTNGLGKEVLTLSLA